MATTKAERETEMSSAEETVLLQIWDNDAAAWADYAPGSGPIEIRYNLWYTDGAVIRRDVADIVVFDGKTANETAVWFGSIPTILRPAVELSEFETKLATKITQALAGANVVGIVMDEVHIPEKVAIGRLFKKNTTTGKVEMFQRIATATGAPGSLVITVDKFAGLVAE